MCNCTIKNGQIAIAKQNRGGYNSHKIQESKGAYPYRIGPFDVLSKKQSMIILWQIKERLREEEDMTGEEIKSTLTSYNLQSWSKQRGLNPIPVVKGEGIYFWDDQGIAIQICRLSQLI